MGSNWKVTLGTGLLVLLMIIVVDGRNPAPGMYKTFKNKGINYLFTGGRISFNNIFLVYFILQDSFF